MMISRSCTNIRKDTIQVLGLLFIAENEAYFCNSFIVFCKAMVYHIINGDNTSCFVI